MRGIVSTQLASCGHAIRRASSKASKRSHDEVTFCNRNREIYFGNGSTRTSLCYEWIVDNDTCSLDMNLQRGHIVCPDLVNGFDIEKVAMDGNNLSVSWVRNSTSAIHAKFLPNAAISCLPHDLKMSKVKVPNCFSELDVSTPVYTSGSSRFFPVSDGCCGWSASSGWTHEREGADDPPTKLVVSDYEPSVLKKRSILELLECYGVAIVRGNQTFKGTIAQVSAERVKWAESVITSIFPILRNSHYGMMSTWSNADFLRMQGDKKGRQSKASRAFAELLHNKSEVVATGKGDERHEDGAYLSSRLDLHTDATYFLDCPKIQAYGCAFSNSKTVGGATTLCDGFSVACSLAKNYPEYFEILRKVSIGGRYAKEGKCYESFKPLITMKPQTDLSSKNITPQMIERISFNNSDRIPFNLRPGDGIDDAQKLKQFYKAYYQFHKIAHDATTAIRFTLKPGDLMMFDNQRILHGRLEYSGPRLMCGAYVSADEYFSSLKTLSK